MNKELIPTITMGLTAAISFSPENVNPKANAKAQPINKDHTNMIILRDVAPTVMEYTDAVTRSDSWVIECLINNCAPSGARGNTI